MALYSILSIIGVLLLLYIYVGIGTFVLKLIKYDIPLNSIRHLILAFALGFGIIGNILTIFGYLQFLSPLKIIFLLIFSFTLASFSYRDIQETVKFTYCQFGNLFKSNKILGSLLIIILICYFLRSLLPPTGFDGLMYHLSTVKLYLSKGGFWDIYFNPQTDFPMLTEMHFMIGIALGNDIIAKGISFLLFIMTLLLIMDISKMICGTDKGQLLSVLIFSTLTVVIANVPNCDVDIAQALWSALSILLIIQYRQSNNIKDLLLSAVIAGMALQSKIFGVFILPVLFYLLISYYKKDCFKHKKKVIVFLLIPLAMGMVWHVKNYIYNETIFSNGLGISLSNETDGSFFYVVLYYIKSVITAPWHYSFYPSLHRGDTVGPIFLMVLPFLFFVKISKNEKLLLISGLIFLLQVLLMDTFILKHGSSIRYIITVLIIFTPIVVNVFDKITSEIYKNILFAFVVLTVGLNTLVLIKRYHKDWLAIIFQKSRDEYLLSILPEYEVIKKINSLSDDKTVMPIYNFSEYLIKKSVITAHKKYDNSIELREDIKKFNIGYIFANNVLDTSENSSSYPFISKTLLFQANGFYLYKVPED